MAGNFYDYWLNLWGEGIEAKRKARIAINPDELKWTRTRQDYRAALVIAPETGFATLGGATMRAEIPAGWKTGKHSHGEEAMYILAGNGFSIIDGRRYDWEEGAVVRVPFGAVHQHFNVGDQPVSYYSALAPHLERSCFVARFEQLEDCGEYSSSPEAKGGGDDHDAAGRRIVLHRYQAKVVRKGEQELSADEKYITTVHPEMRKVQHGAEVRLMGAYDDFRSEEVEITDVFYEEPRSKTQKHAHMEALLYILQGEGYSIIDDRKIPWRPGTAIHIQGPQTIHQHFNTSTVQSQELRIHFGIRKYFQHLAKDAFPYLFFEQGGPLSPEESR